jgi:hypothetical protein
MKTEVLISNCPSLSAIQINKLQEKMKIEGMKDVDEIGFIK